MNKTDKKSRTKAVKEVRSKSDLTERNLTEETLREKERFIRHITELSPVVLDVFDLATENYSYFSSDVLNIFGYTADEMAKLKDPFAELLHPEDIPRIPENINRLKLLADGEINEFECRVRRRDGGWRWVLSRSMVFARDEQGAVRQTVNATVDINERKQAEEELRRQNEVLQKIFDNIPVMVSFYSADGLPMLVNREWERVSGWRLEELQNQNVDILAENYPNPQERQKVLDFIFAAKGEWADFKPRVRDGRVIDAAWANVRLSDGTSMSIGIDITERKRSEEALRESEAKYRTLFDSIDEGFCFIEMIYDAQGKPIDYRFLETNRIFEKQTGLTNAAGKTALELVPDLEGF